MADAVSCDGAQRAGDQVDAIGAVDEGSANIAAGLAAVGVVADERIVGEGILHAGGSDGVDRVDQHLQRKTLQTVVAELIGAIIVLDFLQADDVGRLQPVQDFLRNRVEARRAVVRVEVFGVVARDQEMIGVAGERAGLFDEGARLRDPKGLRRHDLVIAEVVVDDAGDIGKPGANIHVGRVVKPLRTPLSSSIWMRSGL